MKGAMFGAVGLMGVGTAAYVGVGSGPNDYIGTINKSPEAVYAAFAASMGPEGITALPSHDGWPGRVRQRVSKVANDEVRLELVVDNQPFVSMQVQFSPQGENATRVAAEIDLNASAIASATDSSQADALAFMAMGEGLIDMAFAQAMADMVAQVEQGRPLTNLAMISRTWGQANVRAQSGLNQRGGAAAYRGETIRPDASARPMVDPNEAARRQAAGRPSGSSSGWGTGN